MWMLSLLVQFWNAHTVCQGPSRWEQTCPASCVLFQSLPNTWVFSGCRSSENAWIGFQHLSITIYSWYIAFWKKSKNPLKPNNAAPTKGFSRTGINVIQWNLWERHEPLWEAVAFSATFLGSHPLWFNKVFPAIGKGFHSITASHVYLY